MSQRLQLPADLLLSRPIFSSLPPPTMQAFLPPELLLSASGQVGQGLQLLSASQLIQPRAIEQSSEGPLRFCPALFGLRLTPEHLWCPAAMAFPNSLLPGLHKPHSGSIKPISFFCAVAARCAIARCLARQWFGVLLRAATPLDEWLVEGEWRQAEGRMWRLVLREVVQCYHDTLHA